VSSYIALSGAVTRAHLRDRVTLFFTFAFPLIFLVIFSLLFGNAAGVRPIDYLAPGVLSWAVANGAVFGVAYTLVQWRDSGLLRLIRLTPTSVLTVLGSRVLVAVGVALAQIALFVGVALLPPFDLRPGPYAILAVPVLLLGVMAFFAVGMIVGSRVTSSEAVAAIANCLLVPMAFLSGTFYPLDQSPAWLQGLAKALPLRYMIEGTAGVLTGAQGPGAIIVPCAVLLGVAVLGAGLAARFFRWSDAG
jgi:ABC-2 type transport system permease protein